MPGQNLTREEAAARAALVTVDSYDVTLDLTRGEEIFASTTTVRFDATAGASTFIDLIAPTVHSITLNGAALDPAAVYADSRIALENLAEHNELTVVADCAYMHTGEGLHRFTDPADGNVYLYTQFEVPDSRRVYTVFEQPDLKASFTFTVTAPEGWTVFSNSPTPEPVVAGDKATFAFAPTERMSSYITAIVAGPYQGVTDVYKAADGREIPLGTYCRASLFEHMDAEEILDITKRGFAFYEDLFGTPYAFSKYDQLFVPEFNAGAMENAGCVTHRDDYIFRSRPVEARVERRAVTILHELAHMWFGDMVTMKWWNDLWLNESFAEYTSTLATAETTRWTDAWTTFQALEKTWAYNQDQLSSTHPIAAEINDLHDVEVNFDGITYAKGASVLTALVYYVGREAFFKGIAKYLAKHAYANATLADLLVELEAESGRDLKEWTRLWLQEAGVTTLRMEIETDEAGVITSAAVLQEIPAGSPASLRPHRLAIGSYKISDAGAHLTRVSRLELDVAGERTEVPQLVGTARADVIVLNDDDLTYGKVRLDAASLEAGLAHIAAFGESLPRSIVLASAWDMVRDGEMAPSRFLSAALDALRVEEHSSVVQGLLARVGTCLAYYLPPASRHAAAPGTADALLALARAAHPGSDKQLQLVRAVAAHAVTEAQTAAVAGWLDGSEVLEGLVVDQDMRWELLIGLVAAGVAGEAEIAAEAERDQTTTGRERASQARAAIPTPEAKAAAWKALVEDASMPNETQVKTLRGFADVERKPELLAPYVEQYVEAIMPIWEGRTFHMAENLLASLWSPATVGLPGLNPAAALEAWLEAHTDAPAALRRIVAENLDDTRRVATVQAAERA